MRATSQRMGYKMWVLAGPLLLLLAACGSSNADATPTQGLDAIYTSAAQTFAAQLATQVALTPPTSAPSPTLFPTLPPAATLNLAPIGTISFATPTLNLGGGGSACDNSAFVADVTIPDDTVVDAGKAFVKTWLLQNTGTCAWNTSYKLSFDHGDNMGGADVNLPYAVPVGQQVSISVKLKAPTESGTYKSTWQLHNDKGQAFGDLPYVKIKVGTATSTAAPPTDTPTP